MSIAKEFMQATDNTIWKRDMYNFYGKYCKW
jgi:hypothetical protein